MSNNQTSVIKMKHCSKCGKTQLSESFGVDRSRRDGLNGMCKECARSATRVSSREYQRKLRSTPEGRAKASAATGASRRRATTAAIAALQSVQGRTCAHPDCEIESPAELEIDHVSNDGVDHRAEFGGPSSAYYRSIEAEVGAGNSDRYQLLCESHHGSKSAAERWAS